MIKYAINIPEQIFICDCPSDWNELDAFAAETCAEDYYDCHDGWEGKWPVTVILFEDDKEVSRWCVEQEVIPQFSAHNVLEDN